MSYEESLWNNELIVLDILCYRSAILYEVNLWSKKLLEQAWNRLKPITIQEIKKVREDLCLSKSLEIDMQQDAFIKLISVITAFKERVCPSFISFWRRCLRNHLLTLYYSSSTKRSKAIVEEPIDEKTLADSILIEELSKKFLTLWEDEKLFLEIFKNRILPTDEKITQKAIALKFSVTQAYISRVEAWVKLQLQADLVDTTDWCIATSKKERKVAWYQPLIDEVCRRMKLPNVAQNKESIDKIFNDLKEDDEATVDVDNRWGALYIANNFKPVAMQRLLGIIFNELGIPNPDRKPPKEKHPTEKPIPTPENPEANPDYKWETSPVEKFSTFLSIKHPENFDIERFCREIELATLRSSLPMAHIKILPNWTDIHFQYTDELFKLVAKVMGYTDIQDTFVKSAAEYGHVHQGNK